MKEITGRGGKIEDHAYTYALQKEFSKKDKVWPLEENSLNKNINDWRWAFMEVGGADMRRDLWTKISGLQASNPLYKIFTEQ